MIPSYLTQELAQQRALIISNVQYNIALTLEKGEAYSASVTLKFRLSKVQDIYIDYAGLYAPTIQVNGVTVPVQWNNKLLRISAQNLIIGENTITFVFINGYGRFCEALHSYTDSDGLQYIYTNLEPYHCQKIFPCFDQPDLKASFELAVTAPQDWIVVANQNLESKEQLKWVFKKQVDQPTYLFAFVAGPFYKIVGTTKTSQTIYSRQAMKQQLEKYKNFIFEVTQNCLDYFAEKTGIPYAFIKYDTIFCPDYNAGAMENNGCVTFAEHYLNGGDLSQMGEFADVITHEATHHWFGDYVTMKWWDDTWLNEAFASYLSYECLKNIKITTAEIEDVNVMYFQWKESCYDVDTAPSTRGVASKVQNADLAKLQFGLTTYNKGAGVISILVNQVLGKDIFWKAVGQYLQKYAWKNASLDDFISSMEEFSGISLQRWRDEFLTSIGVNTVTVDWDDTNLFIKQSSAPQIAYYRSHEFTLQVFYPTSMSLLPITLQPFQENKLIAPPKGALAILPNSNDSAYLMIKLDPRSQSYFLKNLQDLTPVQRLIVFRSFYDQALNQELKASEFITLVQPMIDYETKSTLITEYFRKISTIIFSQDQATSATLAGIIFNKLLDLMVEEEIQELIPYFANQLPRFAIQTAHVQRLINWIQGTDLQEYSFDILAILDRGMALKMIYSSSQVNTLLNKGGRKLTADQQHTQKLREEAYFANITQQQQLFDSYCDSQQLLSVIDLGIQLRAFNSKFRQDSLTIFGQQFFDKVKGVFNNRVFEYAETFYNGLWPILNQISQKRYNKIQILEC